MKKLTLKLDDQNVLSKESMKKIVGGKPQFCGCYSDDTYEYGTYIDCAAETDKCWEACYTYCGLHFPPG